MGFRSPDIQFSVKSGVTCLDLNRGSKDKASTQCKRALLYRLPPWAMLAVRLCSCACKLFLVVLSLKLFCRYAGVSTCLARA